MKKKKSVLIKFCTSALVISSLAGVFMLATMPVAWATPQCISSSTGMPVTPNADGSCPPGSINPGAGTLSGVSAQNTPITNLSGLIARVQGIINLLIPFLVGLGVFLIIYGVFTYIAHAEDEERRKEGRTFILWGILFVFIMLSVWGILSILVNSFGLSGNQNGLVAKSYPTGAVPNLPQTPTVIDFINRVNAIGPYIIGFFVSVAVFIIIFGIVRYVREAANEEKRAEGRQFIIWGVIFVFVMLSVWGLVSILVNTFQLNGSNPPPVTKLPCLDPSTGNQVDCASIGH